MYNNVITDTLIVSVTYLLTTLPCESQKSKNFAKFSHWTWQL